MQQKPSTKKLTIWAACMGIVVATISSIADFVFHKYIGAPTEGFLSKVPIYEKTVAEMAFGFAVVFPLYCVIIMYSLRWLYGSENKLSDSPAPPTDES